MCDAFATGPIRLRSPSQLPPLEKAPEKKEAVFFYRESFIQRTLRGLPECTSLATQRTGSSLLYKVIQRVKSRCGGISPPRDVFHVVRAWLLFACLFCRCQTHTNSLPTACRNLSEALAELER